MNETVYTIFEVKYREIEGLWWAARTDKQKDSQDTHLEKVQDIKVRVPKEYYDKIKICAKAKGLSLNKLVILLLEDVIEERILSIREKNKLEKESSR